MLEEQVSGWLDGLPLVAGITETVGWCRRNGLVPVLTTLAWSPVGSYLTERFGFHAFGGPRLETTDSRFTGRVACHFDEYDKRDFALAQARELGLAPGSCGAVGDSRSDLPLFASVGLSVAFNASAGARAAATYEACSPPWAIWSQPVGDDLSSIHQPRQETSCPSRRCRFPPRTVRPTLSPRFPMVAGGAQGC
ncbi:HAD family hydrolase [Streptomyces sp. NPDC088348]|uniref:HAD family hydrolase n=1 Tax=Streptomyces sp. NPDC088348 TaxID=3365853 RepID=UPI00382B56CE